MFFAILCMLGLSFWMFNSFRWGNFVLYEKEYMTEKEFWGMEPCLENVDVETFHLWNDMDEEYDARFRGILARNMLEKVTAWDSYIEIEKRFGTNGIVVYDHVRNERRSIFLTKAEASLEDWAIERNLCRESGYAGDGDFVEVKETDNNTMRTRRAA